MQYHALCRKPPLHPFAENAGSIGHTSTREGKGVSYAHSREQSAVFSGQFAVSYLQMAGNGNWVCKACCLEIAAEMDQTVVLSFALRSTIYTTMLEAIPKKHQREIRLG